jgi:hypothetical protein
LSGDTDQFAYANPSSNRCAANQVLESGQSCNLINMNRFAPTSTGAKTMTITVTPASGSVGSNTVTGIGYTYSWSIGEWSEWDSTCSENATRTRVVRCERNDGTFVDDSFCLETKPTTSDTQQILTGCSFSWVENGFGECQGGSYSWVTGDWGPTMACGEIEQTRSVTCAIHTDSGSHSQTLGCRRSDGVMRPLSECDPQTRPVEVKACTPPESICEGAPEASRIVTLDTSCTRDSILQACERARANGQKCLVLPL